MGVCFLLDFFLEPVVSFLKPFILSPRQGGVFGKLQFRNRRSTQSPSNEISQNAEQIESLHAFIVTDWMHHHPSSFIVKRGLSYSRSGVLQQLLKAELAHSWSTIVPLEWSIASCLAISHFIYICCKSYLVQFTQIRSDVIYALDCFQPNGVFICYLFTLKSKILWVLAKSSQ